jgi:hypothetical protein
VQRNEFPGHAFFGVVCREGEKMGKKNTTATATTLDPRGKLSAGSPSVLITTTCTTNNLQASKDEGKIITESLNLIFPT